jgi:hypothetical protein
MGSAQRSRRRLEPGTRCYLCGQAIDAAHEVWDRDHVPPKRIFPSRLRESFSPNLTWLPTHRACNHKWRADEEYFVVSFAGHVHTPVAAEVMRDIDRAARQRHGLRVLRDVVSRLGKIEGPHGERVYSFDRNRVDRFLWKIVRGIYYAESGLVLPERTLGAIYFVSPQQTGEQLAAIPWFPAVRDTESMGKYGAVFDFKWLGWNDAGIRGHAVAMMFWNGLIAAALFHDPTCACTTCQSRRVPQEQGDA